MNNSKNANAQTPEENEASSVSAAAQARIDAIYAFEKEPEFNPERPVVDKTPRPLAPMEILKRGIPGLPKWLIFILLFSLILGFLLAAIFAVIAGNGDVEFALQGGGVAELDRHSFGAMGAFAVLAGLAGFLQFYLRVRGSPTVARKPLREIALFLASILAVGLFILIIWPRDIFVLRERNGSNSTAFLDSVLWVSGANSKINDEFVETKPWFLVLTKPQMSALKTKEEIVTCQTDRPLQIGPLHWWSYRKWDDGKLATPTTIEDIQHYCQMGINLDSISASANAKALLKKQVGEVLDFTDAEIAAAEGRVSDPYLLSVRARYLLFKAAPKTAAAIAVETQPSPSDFSIQGWNGGYQSVDNRIAGFECDEKYARFLISKGVRPTPFEVNSLLNSILWGLDTNSPNQSENLSISINVSHLPTQERDPGVEIRKASSMECLNIAKLWLKTTALDEKEQTIARNMVHARDYIVGNNVSPLTKKIFDELLHTLFLHSGSVSVLTDLGIWIAYDNVVLTEWMKHVNPADVTRKIQLTEDTYKMWCDDTGYCAISQDDAQILLKAFIK